MPDSQHEWENDPGEVCRKFLDEQGTSTHIMQHGWGTMILTKLDRIALLEYLDRLRREIANNFGEDADDLVHVEIRELPNGDRLLSAMLREPVQ